MKTILILVLEMLVCCATLHLLYRLVIEGRVRHVGCRAYILIATALSAVIPALDIRLWRDRIVYIDEASTQIGMNDVAEQIVQSGSVDLWMAILLTIYIIGVCAITISIARQLIHIARLRRTTTIHSDTGIVISPKIDSPFSFLRTIYLPSTLTAEQREVIVQHEQAHIRHNHSIERIAMEVMKAVLWFNPFVWLFSRLLSEAHEFEADSDIIDSGYDKTQYATSIFEQAFGFSPEITNGLHNSLTKKRFKMMTKPTPSYRSLARLAAALPVVAALALLFSVRAQATIYLPAEAKTPETAADSTKGQWHNAEQVTPFLLVEEKEDEAVPFLLVEDEEKKLKYKDIAFICADKMPTFDGNGSLNDFIQWCGAQLNYNNGTAGMRVVMQFVIETDGTIKEVNALQGDAKSCAEAERVIRLSSGRWSAGEQNGEKVRVSYAIPFKFVQR